MGCKIGKWRIDYGEQDAQGLSPRVTEITGSVPQLREITGSVPQLRKVCDCGTSGIDGTSGTGVQNMEVNLSW